MRTAYDETGARAPAALAFVPCLMSGLNFGPSDEDIWPVERIATKVVQMWGNGASWVCSPDPSVHQDYVLRLDASKARVDLGWKPRLKIETALEWTIAWYRAWSRGNNMTEFTAKQIVEWKDCELVNVQSRETLAMQSKLITIQLAPCFH